MSARTLADVIYATNNALPDGNMDMAWADHIARAIGAHLTQTVAIESAAIAMCWENEGRDNAPFSFADDPAREWWNCRPQHERANWIALTVAALSALLGKESP